MQIFATKYEILRNVSPTSLSPCVVQPSAKPVRVALLLNEKKLIATGGLLKHFETVFFEDTKHDWDWRENQLYYYGHAMGLRDVGDIVAILEEVRM